MRGALIAPLIRIIEYKFNLNRIEYGNYRKSER